MLGEGEVVYELYILMTLFGQMFTGGGRSSSESSPFEIFRIL